MCSSKGERIDAKCVEYSEPNRESSMESDRDEVDESAGQNKKGFKTS